jgi:tetratricopeptide (TPR) repeat protein
MIHNTKSLIWLALVSLVTGALAQPTLDSFTPGAKSIGLGNSGIIVLSDPSALYWNPSLLSAINTNQAMLSLHNPYTMNYVGYSQFIPLVGTLAAHIARREGDPQAFDMYGLGWGHRMGRHAGFGVAVDRIQMAKENLYTAGIGFLFKPTAVLQTDPDSTHRPPTSSLFYDKLSVSICLQNIPFKVTNVDPTLGIGAAYNLTRYGPQLVYAHHFQGGNSSAHLGFIIRPFHFFHLYAGTQNYNIKKPTAGFELSWQNVCVNAGYDFSKKHLTFSSTFRLGRSPEELAAQNYQQAVQYLAAGDQKTALHMAKKAIAHDPSHLLAATMEATLKPAIKSQNILIDSLLTNAREASQKGRYMSAAANYRRILKLEPDNEKVIKDMETIRLNIDSQVDRWFQAGVQSFDKGEYAFACDIFESIILVNPEHQGAKDYISKTDDILREKAQNHFFTGLGYYNQNNYTQAEKEFQAAIDADPNFLEALDYLNQISIKKLENLTLITTTLNEAMELEKKDLFGQAKEKYQEILKMDPGHAQAQQMLQDLQLKIADYIAHQRTAGVASFQKKDYDKAGRIFRTILNLDPHNKDAKQYLKRINEKTSGKINNRIELAQLYINEKKYEAAQTLLDSVLMANPGLREVKKLRQEVVVHIEVTRLFNTAKSSYLSGDYKEAIELCKTALEQNPDNQDVKFLKQNCQNRLDEQVDAFFNRGLQLYTQEKYRPAIEEWQKALKLNPQHKGSLEYTKRAQDRLNAIQQLQ